MVGYRTCFVRATRLQIPNMKRNRTGLCLYEKIHVNPGLRFIDIRLYICMRLRLHQTTRIYSKRKKIPSQTKPKPKRKAANREGENAFRRED